VSLNEADRAPPEASIIRRLVQQHSGASSTMPVMKREWIVRVHDVASVIILDYLMLSAYHDFFAIVFIAAGLDQSWEWPPLFGQITKAYTMRRYWSLFWHRLIYRSFNAHATATSSWLGINQKTIFSSFFNNWLVFLLSGIMHGAVFWKLRAPSAWSRNLKYWLLQPVAFMLERVVQHYWGKARSSLRVQHSVLAFFERIVGYIWVFAWLIWEAPGQNFSTYNCNTNWHG